MTIRHDWNLSELEALHALPLLELLSKSHLLHTKFHKIGEIQVCTLISIKTGGCPEDCKYCAQSSRYQTAVSAQPVMRYEEVISDAKKAIARGATRICLGAAWREVRDSKQFEDVLKMITGITHLGVEVCCTLGMLKEEQAQRLKEAGLYAYNHNLDSSENFYKSFVTTRTFQDRLETLDRVEKANLSLCCGGILGMGEEIQDRLELLLTLCTRNPHPESVPINRLSPIEGTPLQDQPKISIWEMLRIIAIGRIVLPASMIRLSAGRIEMSFEEQALCFFAGVNSIHAGEKLLTVANTSNDSDEKMFHLLGLNKRPAFAKVN
ncbi:MAG: biotin synthase BioB [Parachlamydiaceae bacterium]|nr:biotin synthase BioB [Parachlamydiaceae bacterium]